MRRFQVPLGIGFEAKTSLGYGAFLANRSEHVLKVSPVGCVIEHAIGGYDGNSSLFPKFGKRGDAGSIISEIRMPRRKIEPRARSKCHLGAPELVFEPLIVMPGQTER